MLAYRSDAQLELTKFAKGRICRGGPATENGLERSVKLTQLVPINSRHRALTLIRVAGMNRNIFYIIGVIVVIVIVLKLLGVF